MQSLPVKFISAAVIGIFLLLGCGETRTRSREEIFEERKSLPALYLTQSGERTTAPGNQSIFLNESGDEIFFPAYVCKNPSCPGAVDGEPVVFPFVEPSAHIDANGEIAYHVLAPGSIDPTAGLCPECVKAFQLKGKKAEELGEYFQHTEPYVLPETKARQEELDEEYEARMLEVMRRIGGE